MSHNALLLNLQNIILFYDHCNTHLVGLFTLCTQKTWKLSLPYAMLDNPMSWIVPGSLNLCKWMNKRMEMSPRSERKVVTVWYMYSLFNITYLSGIISISRWEKWHLEMLKVTQAIEQDYTHLLTQALLSFQSHYAWVMAPKYSLKWGQHWFFSHVLV